MPARPTASDIPSTPSAGSAAAFVIFALLGTLLYAQAVLESELLSAAFLSGPSWQSLVARLGRAPVPGDPTSVSIPLFTVAAVIVPLFGIALACGAWRLRRATGLRAAAGRWVAQAGRWWLIPGAWWLLSTLGLLSGWEPLRLFLDGTVELWLALALAGGASAWFSVRDALKSPGDAAGRRWRLTAAVVASGVIFAAMNWGLWFNLRVPHGDSAMYEEHLWNVWHGKGFRSYLDQGLFLGEHVQVVHLLLLPVHMLWPSQLLLELCQAFAIAAGAIPVYRMTLRFSMSSRAALLLACAYLLYFPVQYLDLTIDLKTFRPNSLGVPALLFALDAWEGGRRRACLGWLALMLSAQEDYAIVISLFGAWIVLNAGAGTSAESRWSWRAALRRILSPAARSQLLFGVALAAFGVVYLLVVMKVVFPYFRDGATIHYASYFEDLGKTPEEIVTTLLTRPLFVLGLLINVPTCLYAAALLAPLGGLPLRSPGRLLVGAPLFALLCLNKLALQPPAPVHHFHASLAPLLFWAASAALRPRAGWPGWEHSEAPAIPEPALAAVPWARFACLCALATGLFMSVTPLGIKFWDPGSSRYWGRLYVAGERARQFAVVDALIPDDAHVASTDFVHARLTHRERSYDYSDYVRKVADYEHRVPSDTNWIVIDIEHPYNPPELVDRLRTSPADTIRELGPQSDGRWQVVDHPAKHYFIVLKRSGEDVP